MNNQADIQQSDDFDQFNEVDPDLTSNNNGQVKFMIDVDFDNVHLIEKELYDCEIDQFDHMSDTHDDDDDNDDTTTDTSIVLKPIEEKIFSQQFSQLLTTVTTTNENEPPILNKINVEIEKIPNYLTKQNKSFRQMIQQIQSTMTTTVKTNTKIEDLRQNAILIYKIMISQIYHQLWTIYLKSGTGQLIISSTEQPLNYPINVPIWPKELKTIIQATNMNDRNDNEICMTFVNNQLDQLNHQLNQYQTKLAMKTNNFNNYTLIIQTYIEQNLSTFRMKIKHQIELIHYDYHIQALKLEYLRQNPNTYQKQLMKELCTSKYEQEITEQEYDFLEQQMAYYNSPSQSFEASSIAQAPLFDSIQNVNIRQQFYQQYRNIAEQSKAEMFTLYMKTAGMQMNECKHKFDSDIKQMWTTRHSAADNEKIPLYMIQLIEQRYKKISERIQCIYKFKYQCFLSTCHS